MVKTHMLSRVIPAALTKSSSDGKVDDSVSKVLAWKNVTTSSNANTHVKMMGMVMYTCNPSTEEIE